MSDLLEGVRSDSPRNDRALARVMARRGQVAYAVFDPRSRNAAPRNAASEGLRGASCAWRDGGAPGCARPRSSTPPTRFFCDCLIYDRSATGLRLTLARDVGLPPQFQVHDDETGAVELVATVWRRGATLGARFCGYGASTLKPSERAALRGRYYAVRG